MPININTLINQQKKEFDIYYKKLLQSLLSNDELSKAMIYGSINGGKRIRPFLVSIFAKIAKVKRIKPATATPRMAIDFLAAAVARPVRAA